MTEPDSDPLLASLRSALARFNDDPAAGVAALKPHYDPGVSFRDPIQATRGWDEFERMMLRMVEGSKHVSFDVLAAARSGDELYLTWTMSLQPKRGPMIEIDGVTHARLRDERIYDHVDYWDLLGSVMDAVPLAAGLYRKLVAKLG